MKLGVRKSELWVLEVSKNEEEFIDPGCIEISCKIYWFDPFQLGKIFEYLMSTEKKIIRFNYSLGTFIQFNY